jgi:PQQ-dependent dehydrogenase (methanol/ethanol family)
MLHEERIPMNLRLPRFASAVRAAAFAPLLALLCASATPPAAPAAPTLPRGDWTMPAGDYASTRFSPLAQIDNRNAAQLRVEFTFSTGVDRGQEAAPLVVGDTMYVVTPFPNYLYALDLAKPGAPVKWKYDPKPDLAAQGVACCDVVNRGAVYWKGKVIYNTLDGSTVAVDAATGKPAWRTQLGDIYKGESITMAPLVVKDKVLVGNSGGEFGVRGWLVALDAATGKIAWKAFHTGPDKDVLIGPEFRAFYASDKGTDLGRKTWPGESWKIGGGTVWGWISYDPQLDLVFYGTGNPGPWNAEQRPGDNKWTSGIFARDPDTGAARWFYQMAPHDLFDYDATNESLLVDLAFNGAPKRKLLLRPERNGFFYVMDPRTGQVLAADKFFPTNSISRIDLRTGRPQYVDAYKPTPGKVVRNVCPASPGAKDFNPSAYSPRTGLVYVPHINLCMDIEANEVNYIAGTPYVGADVKFYGLGASRGELLAWDPAARKARWKLAEDLPLWSGALVTAGDLVFYGTMDGWFKAVDARDGTLRWKFKTGSGIIGQPIAYRGPDGREYIAVLSGVGGWAGAIVVGNLDARDSTAGGGFVNATRDLKDKTVVGGTLYVFALPPR